MPASPPDPHPHIRLSQVVSALSYALDITEGQPEGHAVRSCVIGMRVAEEINLPDADRTALFYALLLKDLGCSSNASKVCYLFGASDHTVKEDLKTTYWTSLPKSLSYIARNVAPTGNFMQRAGKFLAVAKGGPGTARELVQIRCDRGATIARHLGFPESTALAIRSLDEQWNGRGHPDGLKRDQIPLLSRILNLAQTLEVFFARHGVAAAYVMLHSRCRKWFDPELVKAAEAFRHDNAFWASLLDADLPQLVGWYEPHDAPLIVDDDCLDRIAEGFSYVIDAKSPWTHCHSQGVAQLATGMAEILNFAPRQISDIRRAALLHDIGKLGVSNLILDKKGKLNPHELAAMRLHPAYTHRILARVSAFQPIADLAADHHERLDGKGYYRGLAAPQLTLAKRIMTVADMYEALAAKRPYRQDLTEEQAIEILAKDAGQGICPRVFESLKAYLAASHFVPVPIAA